VFVVIFEMTGNCRSFGCVCVIFVTFAVCVVVVVGICWLFVVIFVMTGNCRSFGCVCVCACVFFVTFAVRVVVVVVGICSNRRTLSAFRTCALSTLSSSRFALSAALSSSHARALSTLSSSRCSLSASNFPVVVLYLLLFFVQNLRLVATHFLLL